MTRNELAGVAQVMRWEFIDTDSGGVLSDNQVERRPWERIEDAHLLIERMVADGLEVVMRIYGKNYGAMALEHVYHNDPDDIETHCHGSVNDAPDFPAAVVELFCRVYDIKED